MLGEAYASGRLVSLLCEGLVCRLMGLLTTAVYARISG